jgi:hypothetical protein
MSPNHAGFVVIHLSPTLFMVEGVYSSGDDGDNAKVISEKLIVQEFPQ